MRKSIIAIIICALVAVNAAAQKKQVIYYKNGKKAIEGNWRIVYTHMETPALLEAILSSESQTANNLQIASKQIHNLDNSYRNRNLQFEGLCTIYYATGIVRQKANYDHVIPQGIFEYYDVDGSLIAKGNYKDGMPDGQWQYFDKSKKYLEASYHAYTQVELDSIFVKEPKVPEPAPVQNFNDYYSLPKILSKATDDYFRAYRSMLPANTRPEGEFIFYKEGEKEVVGHYKNGYRNGDWIRYEGNTEKLKAVYRNNELTALYDVNKKDVLKDTLNVTGKDYAYLFGRSVVVPVPGSTQAGEANGIDPGMAVVAAPPSPTMDNAIFMYVEQMPEFSGDLNKYLQTHIQYPKKGGEGRVILKFVVKADGSIDDVQVIRSLDEACDAEAVRVVSNMPKWKPGKQNGRAVNVSYNLPVTFSRR